MQSNILNENPSEDISVFVVWFTVLGPDAPSEIDLTLLDDPRAVHYWDSDRGVSDFFSEHADEVGLPEVGLLWDAYLLFAPGASWGESPPRLVDWGAPVVNELDELTRQINDIWTGQ